MQLCSRFWRARFEYRYGLAILLTAAALGVRLLLQPVFGEHSPLVIFYFSIMLSAYCGGLGPGILATILSLLAAGFLIMPPAYRFDLGGPAGQIHALVFATLGICLSLLIQQLHQARDRSERQAEELEGRRQALAENEERLRMIVDAVPDYAIYMLDPDGRVASWNSGAERIKGYRAEEIIGRHFSCFYPREDVEHDKPQQALELAREQGSIFDEGWRVRKDGTQFWAGVTVTALRSPDGQLKGFTKVLRDRTESRRARDELLKANQELARSNADLEGFASVVSHDLRSPLLSISGAAELLDTHCRGNVEAEKLLGYLCSSVDEMSRLIRSILNYSRADRGSLQAAPCNPADVLQRVLASLQKTLQTAGGKVAWDPLPSVKADETLLGQLFQNLIENALKYRREEPPAVHVSSTGQCNGQCEFLVTDNGLGMAPGNLNRIFEPFERLNADKGKDSKQTGIGLGLATCKKIVERHGGRIWAESQPGQGSTFHFTLPPAALGDKLATPV